jgi:hypothetical protein
MSLDKLSLGGNNSNIPAKGKFVSDWLGTGMSLTFSYGVQSNRRVDHQKVHTINATVKEDDAKKVQLDI